MILLRKIMFFPPPLSKFHINYYDAYFNKLTENVNNDNIFFFIGIPVRDKNEIVLKWYKRYNRGKKYNFSGSFFTL
jgi:hypothetical protein